MIPGELTASLRSMWLVIARTGWCTLEEVRAESDVVDRISITRRVHDLKARCYVAARPIPKERRAKNTGRGSAQRTEYAVTPDCLVPCGLTAGEVANALLGKSA